MKKYVLVGLQPASLLKIIFCIGIFKEFWLHISSGKLQTSYFKNTFSKTPAVASSEKINLTREVSMIFLFIFLQR